MWQIKSKQACLIPSRIINEFEMDNYKNRFIIIRKIIINNKSHFATILLEMSLTTHH